MAEEILLSAIERRVLGVLIEKSLTTATSYPLTLNALVSGCNQKSNRAPVSSYVDNEVEDCLDRLQERGLCAVCYPAGSRMEKYKQELTEKLDLVGPQKAVIGELLLRGAQSLGDLRSRAARMVKIPTQSDLDNCLNSLQQREFPLVVCLTPGGFRRGARVTHGLYPSQELLAVQAAEGGAQEQVVQAIAAAPAAQPTPASAPASPSPVAADLGETAKLQEANEQLEKRVVSLESQLERLHERVNHLEGELGM